jgi:hypothetical protein
MAHLSFARVTFCPDGRAGFDSYLVNGMPEARCTGGALGALSGGVSGDSDVSAISGCDSTACEESLSFVLHLAAFLWRPRNNTSAMESMSR